MSQYFRVYCLDLMGMGRSSRPEFTAKNIDEAEDFFTNAVEAFRSKFNLEKFILAGHSLGGWVSGVYACKYP